MPDLRSSGMGWSNGPIAGGNGRILALPSDDLLMLGSEHWHYDEAVRAGKRVLFRGMARPGFRPAELGWDARRYVDEITRDAVRVAEPIADFVGWNEWNLCLVPDQLVTARRPTAATMRRYEGDVVTIKTAEGNQVTATANHPILTRHGWMAACLVKEGMEVAQNASGWLLPDGLSFRPMGVAADGFDDVDVPTPISEVFRTLNKKGVLSRREVMAHDLDSNGRYGYVDVVRPNGLLGNTLAKHLQQRSLIASGVGNQSFPSESPAVPLFHRNRATLQDFGLVKPSLLGDRATQGCCRNALPSSPPLFQGLPIHPDLIGLGTGSDLQTSPLEDLQQRPGFVPGDRVSRLAGAVTFIPVTDLSVSQFSGHVYGLTTEDNVILADSIITHNSDERGDHRPDFGDLTDLYALLGGFQLAVLMELRRRPVTKDARLHFGAWAPKDETDYTEHWRRAAELADVMDVHAYGGGVGILAHVAKYRALFPGKPVELTEWHSDLEGPEADRDSLALFANEAAVHPDFRAYYFLYRWFDPPEHQRDLARAIAVEGNPDRLRLFMDPPTAMPAPPPEPAPIPDPAPEPTPMPPPTDPWRYWTADEIARATGADAEHVRAYWPKLVSQLDLAGIDDRPTQVAALATILVEVGARFEPIHEYGTPADWAGYGGGSAFAGRGFIQLTHDYNYRAYSQAVNDLWGAGGAIDLVARPDDALDPDVAAAVLALYFRDHGIPAKAAAGDWPGVRRAVNGGLTGYDAFLRAVRALDGAAPAPGPGPAPVPVTFDRDEPAHPQDESYDCSQEALEWALWAVGRRPSDGWLERTMIAEGVMSAEAGLLDASGAGLADFVRRQYGEFGYDASHEPVVSFDAVAAEIGPYPLLIGGRAWNHWSGVRGYDPAGDVLLLANPADGWMGVGQTMSREQFRALGLFSMVRITHPDLLVPAEPPVPVPTPEPPVPPPPPPIPARAEVDAIIAALAALRDRLPA